MIQSGIDWKKKLASKSLPILQRSLTQVRDLLNSSSVNYTRLSEVISRDPGFSLFVLQKLEQLPNPPKEPITKISVAVPLLGMDLIERATRSLTVLEERLKGPPRRGMLDCYSRGAHAACYAAAIGQRRGDPESGSLYTAALLHDVGEMALWAQAPDKMLILHRRVQQGEERDNVAMNLLGTTYEALNLHLSQAWNLPDLVTTSQHISNSFQSRPLSVMLASALARASSRGWRRQATLDDIELLAEFLDMPTAQAAAWIHSLAAETARELSRLPIPLPAFYMICGDTSTKPPQKSPPATRQVERAAKAAAPDQPPRQSQAPSKGKPTPSAALETAGDLSRKENKQTPGTPAPQTDQAIKKATPEPQQQSANPLQSTITQGLDEIRHELGLQRTMFAILNKEKSALTARLVSASESDCPLKHFSLELTPPNLMSLLMKKPQVIALTPNNFKKYEQAIPHSLAIQINPKGCLAMSVFLSNKPVGLFYADNGEQGEINPSQLPNFKAICQRTLSRLS
jgi:HD-like signal output (HDOD) protein